MISRPWKSGHAWWPRCCGASLVPSMSTPSRSPARRISTCGSIVRRPHAMASRSAPSRTSFQWSGQYENVVRAGQRLQILIPVVLAVICLLLYLTYPSLLEAAHVLLAVPFALSGGIYLLYALGYNMSVAVMVGFIALFGTAVQTAVVMVIYLEETVVRKRQ